MAKKRGSRVGCTLLIGLVLIFVSAISLVYLTRNSFDAKIFTAQINDWFNMVTKNGEDPSGDHQSDAWVDYKFAILSDSHEDQSVYREIVTQIAARDDLAFVAHLGDQSNAGEVQKLRESKEILDSIAAPVYVLPGDHDSNWVPRRDLTNFKQVFNLTRTTFAVTHGDEKYIFIDNSDSSGGISPQTWSWLKQELEKSGNFHLYILMSTPLSNPYLTFKTMGSQSEVVKKQAAELGALLRQYQVKAIFAGDTHTFSEYKDEQTGIPIITVGAAGTNKNPLPLYVVVEILSDGSYNVSSVPLK